MALEGLRGYLQIASGLTEVTKARAAEVARVMLTNLQEGFDAAGSAAQLRKQVTAVADDLLATSRANRDLLLALIRGEVERTVSRLGLLSNDDLERAKAFADTLEARVRDLEDRLLGSHAVPARPTAAPAATGAGEREPAAAAPRPATAKRAATKKTGAQPPARKASKRTATKRTAKTTKRAAGARTTKKTTTKKAATKKATPESAAAENTTAGKTPELRAAPPPTASAVGPVGDLPPAAPDEAAGPGPASAPDASAQTPTEPVPEPVPEPESLPESLGGGSAGAEAPTETGDQP